MRPKALIVGALLLAACSGGQATDDMTSTTDADTAGASTSTTTPLPASATTTGEDCAHVVTATISDDGGTFSISATVSSADTGWEKYADAWQVWDAEGSMLAERVLTHPHENEQPFTRSLSGVEIPEEVDLVTVAARDSVLGFCGDTFTLEVPGR